MKTKKHGLSLIGPSCVSNNLSDLKNRQRFYSHISEVLSGFADRVEQNKLNPMTPEEFEVWSNK